MRDSPSNVSNRVARAYGVEDPEVPGGWLIFAELLAAF